MSVTPPACYPVRPKFVAVKNLEFEKATEIQDKLRELREIRIFV
jgi:hypothetical protein